MKKYLTWKGRINRFRFLNLELLLILLIAISAITTLPLIYPSRYDSSFVTSVTNIQLYTNLMNLPIIYFAICFKIRRFHDLNKSAFNLLWLLIPGVNLYFIFILFFFKGTDGDNRFGEDRLKKSNKSLKESA